MPPQTALPRGSEFSVSGPSIQNRVVTREQSIEAVDSPTCRPKVNFAGLVTESFVIGFDGNAPVYGEVTFPAELDGDQLERVAVQLLNLARAKQGRPIPSTHAFSPTS